MRRQYKTAHWANPLASENQGHGPSKELRGLSICQDPHLHSISVFSCQRTNENVYSLNTAKQVTICCDLSWYRVFHCFLTPSFVLLGASAKSRCLGKLSHPHRLAGKSERWFLSPKLPWLQNLQFLILPQCGPTTSPTAPKKEQNYCQLACRNHLYLHIPVASVNHKLSFGPAVHIILSQNLK